MAELKLHNSLTRKKQVFEPLDPDHVKMYVCGPTVYNYAHIGNARPAVVFDVLRRVLESLYPKVTHAANITDIDDKIMDAALQTGRPIEKITREYTDIYNADMAALGVRVPTVQPRATEHVGGMIAMIETLIQKNHAYEKEGHVLFHVPSFSAYGALSGRNRDEQIAGARVDVAPYKRDPADFVLWKPSEETQPGWDSPWGRGRPGWHIECSAMAGEYLGEIFDIHGGGLDLIFPHHENEIAQSCCASGENDFARYWIHNGFVTVEGEKMSKSVGNVLLVHDLLDQGIPGEAIRLSLLSAHYRQPLDWTEKGLQQSLKTLDKWYEAAGDIPGESHAAVDDGFMAALYDDLNTPLAIARLHQLAKDDPAALKAAAGILGLLPRTKAEWQALSRRNAQISIDVAAVEALIAERNKARADKDFARADVVRDQLQAMGVTIRDGNSGTTWEVQ